MVCYYIVINYTQGSGRRKSENAREIWVGVELPASPRLPLVEDPRVQAPPRRVPWLPPAIDLCGECLHEHTSFSKV